MRILALTNLYPNPQQPQRATYNRQIFSELAKEHPLRVIAPVAWTDEVAAWRQGKPALRSDGRTLLGGVPVEHPRYWYVPGMLRGWAGKFLLWSVRRAFDRATDEFRPDVVLACWAYPDGWAAIRLARRAGLPVVIKVVGSDILCVAGVRRRKAAEALRQADGVVAVSKDLADKVIALGVAPDRVRVVYTGVDTTLFTPGDRSEARARLNLSDDAPMLLFIGNLVRVKGLDTLIAALGRLEREGCAFRCWLVGEGPLRGELARQAMKEGIGHRVRFVGTVAHAQLPHWFRAADLFVLPSRSEGVPNVLLEASACRTPYVASRVGGIPEIAGSGDGLLVAAGDVVGLAEAIAKRLRSLKGRRDVVSRALRSFADGAREIAQILADVTAVRLRSRPQRARGGRRLVQQSTP